MTISSKNKNKNKKNKKTIKLKKLQCAPNKNNKINNKLSKITCYKDNDLLLMKKLWNKNNIKKIKTNNPVLIWNFLKNNMNSKCYNELCWLNNNTFNNIDKEFIIKNTFRPFSPKIWNTNPYEWLSSVDILKVMKQYEDKYSFFKFLGPSPIDFGDKLYNGCVNNKICNLNINNYINSKINKIGIIFNTDPHYKDGEHWIALFIDIDKKYIFYFDSNGNKIPNRIQTLINRIVKQGKINNISFKVYSNENVEHQKKDGQCGMYTLYFIIELLNNKNPNYFLKNRIPDEEMVKYRKKYFNTLY